MTQHAMAIQVRDLEEANLIVKCITSEPFKEYLKSCMWSTFAIDWNMFTDFKRTFYREFLEDAPTLPSPTLSIIPPLTIPDYKAMNKPELIEQCKKQGLKGFSTKKKEELIKMLEAC